MTKNERKYKIAVLGGDRRQAVLAKRLLSCGHRVRLFGLGEWASDCVGAEVCSTVERAIAGSEIVLLPLPVTRNGRDLSLPASPSPTVKLAEVVRLSVKNRCVALLGGMIPEDLKKECENGGLWYCDYYGCESLQRKNALPSAEGALMVVMENTEITVRGMKALVCGYGRIGSLLADILRCLGADVTVAARRDETLCELALEGYETVRIVGDGTELSRAADACDVILNTVPHTIFTEAVLRQMKNKPLYVEIASSPGGIDLSYAGSLGMRTVSAPSLPGRYSPVSAGIYIFETVSDILLERGIKL